MSRVTAEAAGYMELAGATKDADCEIVQVNGGVSKELGCCNLYKPESGSKAFRCGTCTEVMKRRVVIKK
jgi:hypothetical protein